MKEHKFNKGTKVKWAAYGTRAGGSGTVDRYEPNGEEGRKAKDFVVIKVAGGGEIKMDDGSLMPA